MTTGRINQVCNRADAKLRDRQQSAGPLPRGALQLDWKPQGLRNLTEGDKARTAKERQFHVRDKRGRKQTAAIRTPKDGPQTNGIHPPGARPR